MSGKPTGYASAGIQGTKLLASNSNTSGIFGSDAGAVKSAAGVGGNLLGIYSGLQQGGVAGDTHAAVSAASLATKAGYLGGATGSLANVLPVVGDALALYNFYQTGTKSGKTGADAVSGAETGAEIGSAFGPIGTGVGAVIGGAVGAIASAFGPGAEDPENVQWNGYAAAYDKNPASVAGGSASQNFQSLAGIFDARGSSIPFYQQFGRQGENQFMSAMGTQVNSAISAGTIPKDATASQIYSSVVQPWITGMSKSGWQDSNTIDGAAEKPAIGNLLTNIIGQWQSGQTFNGIAGQTVAMPLYANSATQSPMALAGALASPLMSRSNSSRASAKV